MRGAVGSGPPARRWVAGRGGRWAAGLVLAVGAAALVLWPWLDPRYSFYGPGSTPPTTWCGSTPWATCCAGGPSTRAGWPDLYLGYGYPLLNYYRPRAYYLAGAGPHRGVGLPLACSWSGALAAALGAGGAYALAPGSSGQRAAALARWPASTSSRLTPS